jgi:hypothetical protein
MTMSPNMEIEASAPAGNILNLDFGQEENVCSVCRGKGCSTCVWIGTSDASELYWETRSLIAHFLHAA